MSKQAYFVQDGKVIDYSPSANVSVGNVVPLANFCGVAMADIASGDTGPVKLDGVWDVAAESGTAWTVGEKVYWDATNKCGTAVSTSNTFLGYAVAAKASATTTGRVRLGQI